MMSSSSDEDSFDFLNDFGEQNEEDGARDQEAIGKKTIKRKGQEQRAKERDISRLKVKIKQDKEDFQKQLTNQHEKENGLLEEIESLKNQCQAYQKRTHELEEQLQSNNVQTELEGRLQQAEELFLALKKDNHSLEEEKKGLLLREKETNEKFQKQLASQHETDIRQLQVIQSQCQAYQKRNHELVNQQKLSNNVQTELEGKLQQAEGTILSLENDKFSLVEEKERLLHREKETVEEFQKQLASQNETEKGLLQEIQKLSYYEDQCRVYQKEIHAPKKQQEHSSNFQTELEGKLQQAEGTILALKKDKSSLEEEKERLLHREKKTVEEFQKQLASQDETEKGLLQQIQKLSYCEGQCRVYQKEIHGLKKQQEHSSNFQTELERKLQQAEGMFLALKKDKNSLEEEKERLLHRLSQLAGAKLTLDNPNIADLSDTKRPTKLAEEFAELYDNEWTDAFEDVNILDEQTKTTFMLKLLQRTNEICREVSNAHMDGLKKGLCTLTVRSNDNTGRSSHIKPEQKVNIALNGKEKETEEMVKAKRSRRNSQLEDTETRGPSMEHEVTCDFDVLQPDQKKSIIELRKCIEINLSKDLEEVVTDVIAKEKDFDKETQSAVFKYVAKCVNICWSMCRVEPPVYISFTEVQGDFSLDTNVYKSYTKTGKFIDYIVWPAVYLHENGPLLCKGVAQGRT